MAVEQKILENFSMATEIEKCASVLGSHATVEFNDKIENITIKIPDNGTSETIVFPKIGPIISTLAEAYFTTWIDKVAGTYQCGLTLRQHYKKLATEAKEGRPGSKIRLMARKIITDKVGVNRMLKNYRGSVRHWALLDREYPQFEHAASCKSMIKAARVIMDRNVTDVALFKNMKREQQARLEKVVELLEDSLDVDEWSDEAKDLEKRLVKILEEDEEMKEEIEKADPEAMIGMGNGDKASCPGQDGTDHTKNLSDKVKGNGCTYDPKQWAIERFKTAENANRAISSALTAQIKRLLPIVYRKFFGEDNRGEIGPRISGNRLLPNRILKYIQNGDMRMFSKRWRRHSNNCTVFFCIDLSGSMGGQPRELVINAMRVLGYALETAGIKCGMYAFGSSFLILKEPNEPPTCGTKFWGLPQTTLPCLGGTSGFEAMHEMIKRVEQDTSDRKILFMGTDGGWCSQNNATDNSVRWWCKQQESNSKFDFVPLGIAHDQATALSYAREMATHLRLPSAEMLTAVCSNPAALVPSLIRALDKRLEDASD